MTIAIIGATGQLGALTIDALLAPRHPRRPTCSPWAATPSASLPSPSRGLRTADPRPRRHRRHRCSAHRRRQAAADLRRRTRARRSAPRQRDRGRAPRRRRHLVYTSALQAPTTILGLAAEHKATEELITASGIPATFLRNGWYTENHQQEFTTAREHGVIANSVGDGRLATAPRKDYAAGRGRRADRPRPRRTGLRAVRRHRLELRPTSPPSRSGPGPAGPLPGAHPRAGAPAAARLRPRRGHRRLHGRLCMATCATVPSPRPRATSPA